MRLINLSFCQGDMFSQARQCWLTYIIAMHRVIQSHTTEQWVKCIFQVYKDRRIKLKFHKCNLTVNFVQRYVLNLV